MKKSLILLSYLLTLKMTLSAFHPGGDPGIATEASSDRLSQTQAQTHCPR